MSDDWLNEKGKVTKSGEVPLLDPAQEYVLSLEEMSLARGVKKAFKGKEKVIDEFKTIWKVEGKEVKVWQSFNKSWNKKSTLVGFIERLYGIVLKEEEEYSLGEFFSEKMRIRCHLELQEGGDAESRFYNISLNTLRRYNSDPAPAPTGPPATTIDGLVEFIKTGNFASKDAAESCAKQFLGVTDPAMFAAAWSRAHPSGEIITGS